jgi:hypothetical protein
MTRERWTIRTYPAGAASSGIPYTVKLHLDDSTLASGNTDASGQATYTPNLSPGPHYITATDTAPTPDAVRVMSSKSYGSGGAYSLAELPIILRALGTGVLRNYLNTCAVTYDGAGLDLDTNTGAMLALGIPAVINTSVNTAISAALRDATNPKQCYWCAVFTGIGQAEEGKVVLSPVCGTAAASPSLPALTQSETTYQFPLATFRLPNTGSTTLTQVTDVRAYLQTRNPTLSGIASRANPAIENTTTSTTGVDAITAVGSETVTLVNGVIYDIQARGFLVCKISAAPFQAQIAVYINGVGNISGFISTTNTTYISLSNAHALTMVGTGAAITCGIRVKVTGGTMTYQAGQIEIVATPRS